MLASKGEWSELNFTGHFSKGKLEKRVSALASASATVSPHVRYVNTQQQLVESIAAATADSIELLTNRLSSC